MSGVRTRQLRPVVARRLLRFELACALRERGVSHEKAAARLRVSRASFSQMIAGHNLPHPAALEIVAHYLGIGSDLPWLLELLACARSERSRPAPSGDRELAEGLEAYADAIEVYDAAVLSPLMVDGRRGAVLNMPHPPAVWWLVEEHVLRRSSSGAATVRQVERMRRVAELEHVTIRVLPQSRAVHPGLLGGFQVVRARGRSIVCEDTRQVTHYHLSRELVAEYRSLFAHLWNLALSPEASMAVLQSI